MGSNTDDKIIMRDDLSRMDSIVNVKISGIGKNNSLDVLRQQLFINILTTKLQKSSAYPELSAVGYFGLQQFQNDLKFSTASNSWLKYQYIGINFSVPIFTGLTNSFRYKSTVIEKNVAQIQLSSSERESVINDRLLVNEFSQYQDIVKISLSSYKLYGQNLELNKEKYQEGIINMEIYFRSFLDYLNAENSYLSTLLKLLTIRATIISRQ